MMILRSSKVGREPEDTVEPIKMLQVSVYCRATGKAGNGKRETGTGTGKLE